MSLRAVVAPPRLDTPRLVVRVAQEADVPSIVRYYRDNREHLRPWEPVRPDSFFQPEFWRARVRRDRHECLSDQSLRLFLFQRQRPEHVAGVANFTQFVRGASHSCVLGYNLAADVEGQGLMREALQAALAHLFGPARMHRVQAGYMPHNRRSGALLRRLGFVVEGYARDYLMIAGRWEDHVIASLTNPDWTGPP